MAYQKENYAWSHRRYGSQPISIPFLWEQKPGLPKRDWAYEAEISEANPGLAGETVTAPVKLVISVPFQWEEKPGKPIQTLDRNPDSTSRSESVSSWNPFNAGLFYWDKYYGEKCHKSVSESDLGRDSSSSAADNDGTNGCFIDFLYQLPNPSVGFLGRVYEQNYADPPVCGIDNQSQVVKKRKLTLGELILLSRNLNCPKKPVYIRSRSFFSMEFTRKGLFACIPFGTCGTESNEIITR